MTKLAPDGALIFDFSNRHLELGAVLAAAAEANGLVMADKRDLSPLDSEWTMRAPAEIAVIARRMADTGLMPGTDGWIAAHASGVLPWTDDFCDLAGAIWRKFREP